MSEAHCGQVLILIEGRYGWRGGVADYVALMRVLGVVVNGWSAWRRHCAVAGGATLLWGLLVVLSGVAAAADLGRVPAATWVTDGAVRAVVPIGGRVYIAGRFTYVGPLTGSGAPLSRATGLPLSGFAGVDDEVDTAVADGAGGYYIGGGFTGVGGVARSGVAHLYADGTVDRTWTPPEITGSVAALAVSGSTVYVGGNFTSIGGEPRHGFAALDARTGALTGWNPEAQLVLASGTPDGGALAVSGDTVYLGGSFNRIAGQERDGLAAVDASTGAARPWNPGTVELRPGVSGGFVSSIAVAGPMVYVGGSFTGIGGQARNDIAAIDASSGAVSSWNPNAEAESRYGTTFVRAVAVLGSTVYVGGQFTTIGGQQRSDIAALDAASGVATPWNPGVSGDWVNSIAVAGPTVYVGGDFTRIGGQLRTNIAAVDARTGSATAWQPGASNLVLALAVSDSTVYAGGGFESVGGDERSSIAAVDPRTGGATPWNPGANGSVDALARRGGWIYAGGDFTRIGGRARSHLAALSISTGAAGAWNPNANSGVYALSMSRSRVYAGGAFTRIDHRKRNHLAELGLGTGRPTAWNPGANGDVLAVAISRSRVYAGGTFTRIGIQARERVAAIDAATGRVMAWNPSATCNSEDETGRRGCYDGGEDVVEPRVSALAVSGSRIYIGGRFEHIGGKARNYIAAIDASSGSATSWQPRGDFGPGHWVSALAMSGSTIYIGRSDSQAVLTLGVAAFSTRTGKRTWSPAGSFGTLALAVSNSRVYVGGDSMEITNPFSTSTYERPLLVSGYSAVFGRA